MIHLQVLNPLQSLLLVLLEAILPIVVEVLHVLVADLHIFAHLRLLNVRSELVLIRDDLSLQEPHLFHKVLVQLILVNLAALLGEQLHFLLDKRKNADLLVLVQDTVTTLVKDLEELVGCVQPQKVEDVLAALLKDQANVCLVQQTLLPEVGLLDGLPNFLALASTSDQGARLRHQSVYFVAWHVCQTRESLLT